MGQFIELTLEENGNKVLVNVNEISKIYDSTPYADVTVRLVNGRLLRVREGYAMLKAMLLGDN